MKELFVEEQVDHSWYFLSIFSLISVLKMTLGVNTEHIVLLEMSIDKS